MRTAITMFLMVVFNASSATYYIDYNAANDSANGTSTSTPWKRQPYMVGFAGSYAHTAGDRFVFKGGVTWPSNCFQMAILAGGTSASVRDYYGVDASWFTGGAWTRPSFDFEQTLIGNGLAGAGVNALDKSNIIVDNLEFMRHRSRPTNDLYSLSLAFGNASSNIIVMNCLIRDWDMVSPVGTGGDGASSGGVGWIGSGSPANVIISNCTVHQSTPTMKTGCAVYGFPTVLSCTIYEVCNAYIGGGGTVRGNHIYNVRDASDPITHENAILVQSPADIDSNLIHGVPAGITGIFLDCAFGSFGVKATNLVCNNVVFDCGQTMAMDCGGDSTNTGYRIYNNTLESDNSSYCMRTVTRFNGDIKITLGFVDIKNNHLITSGAIAVCADGASAECGPVFTLLAAYNLTQTVAQAISNGYLTNSYLAPTAQNITANAGTNLSAYLSIDRLGLPRASWNIGAYEYQNPGTTNLVRTNRRRGGLY